MFNLENNEIKEQIRNQLNLPAPVRTLYTWAGRKVNTCIRLCSLVEPVWAVSGGESFLSAGPYAWFYAKARKRFEKKKRPRLGSNQQPLD